MKNYFVIGIIACLPWQIRAAITINIEAELLKTGLGQPMPSSGLVLLVANISQMPQPWNEALKYRLELKRWDLTSSGGGGGLGAGLFQGTTGPLTFGSQGYAGWSPGQLLELLWFPTLTLDSTVTVGTRYGEYSHNGEYYYFKGLNGGAAWVTPPDGSTITLKFFTMDATILNSSGENSPSFGNALHVMGPEPQTCGVVAGLLCLGYGVLRRRFVRTKATGTGAGCG
ncbi:MAG: hypothetical protein HY735_24595 [Verrucomicrobia bacterium]|nr:hypothetical protein [Verrucomicrobiota bacterium]